LQKPQELVTAGIHAGASLRIFAFPAWSLGRSPKLRRPKTLRVFGPASMPFFAFGVCAPGGVIEYLVTSGKQVYNSGAALYVSPTSSAEYGSFNGDTWTKAGFSF
jgi:hypothetical protein